MYIDPTKHYRYVKTGMFTDKAYLILRAIFGQLSDGKWENSSQAEKWWKFAAETRLPNGEVAIAISMESYLWEKNVSRPGNIKSWNNPYTYLNDYQVKAEMAKRLRAICADDIHANQAKDGWTGGWRIGNKEISEYVSYNHDVTFGDCHEFYDLMMGKMVNSELIGTPNNPVETKIKEKVEAFRAKRTEELNLEIAKIEAAKKAEIEAITAKYQKMAKDAAKKCAADIEGYKPCGKEAA